MAEAHHTWFNKDHVLVNGKLSKGPPVKTHIRLNGQWYDLTKWKHSHPGGPLILEQLHGTDASDSFLSLHSEDAQARALKMPKVAKGEEPKGVAEAKPHQLAYRKMMQQMKDDGKFNRKFIDEAFTLIPTFGLLVVGSIYANTHPVIASLLIGLGMEQAGWVGHDHTHGRGAYSDFLGNVIGGWCNGFSRSWWSNKHNTHHVFTNHVENDEDINNHPVLFNYPPQKEGDSASRAYQHLYFPVAYTLLYFAWRMNGIKYTLSSGRYKEFFLYILPNYIWLATLPLGVTLASIIIAGACVAFVVTLSHESEELLHGEPEEFISAQFKGTRDIITPNAFMHWFFGGMQFQLEHHLFPTLPRVHYPWLQGECKKYAKEHGLPYKASPLISFLKIHYNTLKKNAMAPALTGPRKTKAG